MAVLQKQVGPFGIDPSGDVLPLADASFGDSMRGTAIEERGLSGNSSTGFDRAVGEPVHTEEEFRSMSPRAILMFTREQCENLQHLSLEELKGILRGLEIASSHSESHRLPPEERLLMELYRRVVSNMVDPGRGGEFLVALPPELILRLATDPGALERLRQETDKAPAEMRGRLNLICDMLEAVPGRQEHENLRSVQEKVQLSPAFIDCLRRAHDNGVAPELLDRAKTEMAQIIIGCVSAVQEREHSLGRPLQPHEVCAMIHTYLNDKYHWAYATSDNLIEGLATHQLDCDTASHLYVEIGKYLGRDFDVGLIFPEINSPVDPSKFSSKIGHAMVFYRDSGSGKPIFAWESTDQRPSDPEVPLQMFKVGEQLDFHLHRYGTFDLNGNLIAGPLFFLPSNGREIPYPAGAER